MKRRAKSKPVGDLLDALPPSNLDAERNLLSALLGDPNQIGELNLSPSDFWEEGHGIIFATMPSLHQRGAPVEPVTILDQLQHAGCDSEPA